MLTKCFYITSEDEDNNFEPDDLGDLFYQFLEVMPYIQVEDEHLKINILRILMAYENMFKGSVDNLEEKEREVVAKIKERKGHREVQVAEAQEILSQFSDKLKVTQNQMKEARRHPLHP